MPALFSNHSGESVGLALDTAAPALYSIKTQLRPQGKPGHLGEIAAVAAELALGIVTSIATGNPGPLAIALASQFIPESVSSAISKTLIEPVTDAMVDGASAVKEYIFGTDGDEDALPGEQSYFALNGQPPPELDTLMGNLGYIVGVKGNFKEEFDPAKETMTDVADSRFGEITVHGICFSGPPDGSTVARNGIEGVMTYYGFTRISNNKIKTKAKDGKQTIAYLKVSIGQFVIPRCFVVGLRFELADVNARIYAWELTLAVQPTLNKIGLANPKAADLNGFSKSCLVAPSS